MSVHKSKPGSIALHMSEGKSKGKKGEWVVVVHSGSHKETSHKESARLIGEYAEKVVNDPKKVRDFFDRINGTRAG